MNMINMKVTISKSVKEKHHVKYQMVESHKLMNILQQAQNDIMNLLLKKKENVAKNSKNTLISSE